MSSKDLKISEEDQSHHDLTDLNSQYLYIPENTKQQLETLDKTNPDAFEFIKKYFSNPNEEYSIQLAEISQDSLSKNMTKDKESLTKIISELSKDSEDKEIIQNLFLIKSLIFSKVVHNQKFNLNFFQIENLNDSIFSFLVECLKSKNNKIKYESSFCLNILIELNEINRSILSAETFINLIYSFYYYYSYTEYDITLYSQAILLLLSISKINNNKKFLLEKNLAKYICNDLRYKYNKLITENNLLNVYYNILLLLIDLTKYIEINNTYSKYFIDTFFNLIGLTDYLKTCFINDRFDIIFKYNTVINNVSKCKNENILNAILNKVDYVQFLLEFNDKLMYDYFSNDFYLSENDYMVILNNMNINLSIILNLLKIPNKPNGFPLLHIIKRQKFIEILKFYFNLFNCSVNINNKLKPEFNNNALIILEIAKCIIELEINDNQYSIFAIYSSAFIFVILETVKFYYDNKEKVGNDFLENIIFFTIDLIYELNKILSYETVYYIASYMNFFCINLFKYICDSYYDKNIKHIYKIRNIVTDMIFKEKPVIYNVKNKKKMGYFFTLKEKFSSNGFLEFLNNIDFINRDDFNFSEVMVNVLK